MSDDYSDSAWRFDKTARGVHASHRSDAPAPAPRVVVGERSGTGGGPARFYDPSRFARAKEVAITKVGEGQYHAASQSRKGVVYVVNVVTMDCECEDKWFAERVNGGRCKHLLAALMQERDPAMIGQMVDDNLRMFQRLRDAGLLDEGE